ncbi:MAG: serine/threonine-protein kinase [Chthoniobacterales bacterium]
MAGQAVEGLCPVCLLDAALADGTDGPQNEFRYELIEEISRGGMGVVYRASQHGSQRQVAVKMILADQAATPGMMERFRAEAEAIASLDHPHILPLYEAGEHEGLPFYSMKFADRGTLRERMSKVRPQPRDAAQLMAKIARAVHHAHQRGILHRDLKPGNILLDGPEQKPFVSDFGIAKWIGRESALTLFPTALGTPYYVAPEQAAGASAKLTTAADIYSLGAILYELLSGRPPFAADTALETLRLAAATAPPSLEGVPRDLNIISLKCLAKEPAGRYSSAAALAEDLERWLEGRAILARPSTSRERLWLWARRNPVAAGLAAAFLALLLASAIGSAAAALRISSARDRAVAAEKDGVEKLYGSYLDQARASRLAGKRFDSLAAAEKAAQIHRSREVRDATIAALTLVDMRPGAQWTRSATLTMNGGFDDRLERYAVQDKIGEISVRRVSDQTAIIRLAGPDAGIGYFHRFSASGRYLAAKFEGGASWVWDLTNGEVVVRLQGDPYWTNGDVVFTPDSKLLAFSRAQGGVAFYRLDHAVDAAKPDWEWEDAPRCHHMAFDHTGKRLAMVDVGFGTAQGAQGGAFQIRALDASVATIDIRRPFGFASVSWSPDDKLIAVTSHDHQAHLFDATNGEVRNVLRGHLAATTDVRFSHDGKLVATAGFDNVVRLWDVASGASLVSAPGTDVALEFSADDRRLSTGFADGSLGWLEIAKVEILRTLAPQEIRDRPFALAASNDGRWAATAGDGFFQLWDAHSGTALPLPDLTANDGARLSIIFGPDSRTIYASSRTRGLSRWTITEDAAGAVSVGPREWLNLPVDPGCLITAISEDGQQLVVSYLDQDFVSVVSLTGGPPVRVDLRGHPHAFQVALSPDGRWAASGARVKGGVRVWDRSSGEIVHAFEQGEDAFVAFSPDSQWLLTATGRGYQLWRTGTWEKGPRIEPETGAPLQSFAVATSPQGDFLAVQQNGDRIALYDARTVTLLANLESPRLAHLEYLRFTGDGKQLAALGAGQIIQLWDIPAIRQALRERGLDWD